MKKLFLSLMQSVGVELEEVVNKLKEKLSPIANPLLEVLQEDELLIPPGLVLLSASVFNNRKKGILPALFTLLVNIGSYLHSATHSKKGREKQLIVLAGDYVCAHLFQLLCETGCFFLLERFARLISVMNEGSAVLETLKRDVLPQQNDVCPALMDGIRRRYGVFFGECCSLGCLFAGGTEEEQQKLYSFGVKLGVSYGAQKHKIASADVENQIRMESSDVLGIFAKELLSLV
ncbi:MAG: hypothetical protein ACPLTR_07640 [Thermacetogeniaceae bacterium]